MKHTIIFLLLTTILPPTIAQELKTEMVLIPGGEFTMGKEIPNSIGFSPAHKVSVDSFYMDNTEVTNQQYLEFCQATDNKLPEFWNNDIFRCGEKYPNYPIVGINFWDAKKYAEWAGKRLPTEAEWEYAARGGLINKDYPTGDEWTKPRAKQDSTGWKNLIDPVGSYEPNAFGLYDMSGNVWEWVADRHSENYYEVSEYDNPKGPTKGSNQVIRSGSWHSGGMCKKVFYRKGLISNWCDYAVGFRCVKDVE